MIDRTVAASTLLPGAYFTECRVDYRMLSDVAQAPEMDGGSEGRYEGHENTGGL